jgi:hypothetical protein
LVRTRATSERKTEDAPAPTAPASDAVEKCVNCQYYDRKRAGPVDGKAPMWGQCRRHSPHLNPVTAKAYVVEGVWPLVRDDDWCGEWRVLSRTAEEPLPETATVPAEDTPAAAWPRPRLEPAMAGAPVAFGDD